MFFSFVETSGIIDTHRDAALSTSTLRQWKSLYTVFVILIIYICIYIFLIIIKIFFWSLLLCYWWVIFMHVSSDPER